MNEDYYILRVKKRIKQKDVADFLSVHPSAICKYEHHKCTLSRYNIEKYRRYILEH
jgi:predicted transcriptional regulator